MDNMSTEQLHVMFFPFMAHGHMIPILDMAKLFASRAVKATIITTTLNAPTFEKAIEKTKQLGFQISLQIIKFPAAEVGLPEGCENADQLTSEDMTPMFFTATTMLQQPLEHILQEFRPNCLVADMFFPWSIDAAAKFNIPTLLFHGTNSFALCAGHSMRVYKPVNNVSSDSEPFVLPNLPHEIKLIRTQLSPLERADPQTLTGFAKFFLAVTEADVSSYGVIFNSFYELEPDYADHYRKILNRRIWHVGPVSLCNRSFEDKAERGKKATIDQQECLKWLDSKKPNSVIYVCFGSVTNFTGSQLYEIAMALEASGQDFIWVIRKVENDEDEEWLPEGFEERVKGKGLIIKGWAPQVLILDHEATGGFMTHCGWNSTLEGVSAGVPMVTWPFFADQFYNEKLVTEILKTGVSVGAKEWNKNSVGGITKEAIEKAVKSLMAGEDSLEMRKRAEELKEAARKAVEAGGSSYCALDAFIKELSSYQRPIGLAVSGTPLMLS